MAGMFVDIVLFPLDTIKTRIQATIKGQKIDYVKKAGNVSKYSGLKSQVFASFPAAAAFFSTYDFTKYILLDKFKVKQDYIVHMCGAILGEASQVLIRNPFELIKQNMQIGKYNSIKESLVNIFKEGGFRGLYRGYFITVLREIPFGIIQYPLYEKFRNQRKNKNPNGELNTLDFCISGAKAGGIAAFVTTPIDVIKTRIMTYGSFDLARIKIVVQNIYTEEGLSKFFSGVHIRVTYITIGGMIFFGTNEVCKKFLGFNRK
jgi:solute carrier family 25 (mitochondrial S-adenosylmethionine transporter), member 26